MRPSLPDLTAVPTQPDPAGVASWHEYPGSALLGAVRGTRFATAAGDTLDLARLPERAMRQTADEGLRRAAGTLSGVRLEFDTRAGRIDLVVHIRRHVQSTAAPPGLAAIFVATIDDVDVDRVEQHEGSVVILEPDGGTELRPGSDTRISLALPGAPASRTVEVWLPHNAHVRIHSIRADAPIGPSSLPQRLRWTHYGSSISHCVTADGPTGVWPVLAARRLGWDVTSFAVAGQAMLDPFVARAIAAQPADLVTLKVGINLVNHAAMSLRTFEPALHGFVDVIRDQQPETPIVLISPIYSPLHERTPGPLVRRPDNSLAGSPQNEGPGALTLMRVREAVERVVATREDSMLAYLSGLEILGEVDAHLLVDRLHPDAAGYRIVGERFATLARARGWGGAAA